MEDTKSLLKTVEEGFKTLSVSEQYKSSALHNIKTWLTDPQYKEYSAQIKHLIENKYWDYLLDSFYQVIPFGTGGRRGEVGVGTNRINPWTIKSSCQGHSQFLLKHYGDEAKERGVVISFDVREFFGNSYLSDELENPVMNLTCKDLAEECVRVYSANGIKVYLFDDFRSTPELSFAIRFLKAVGGDMISASHNPPEHNGQKVFDEYGGQLIPPDDEKLVKEVTEHMGAIEEISIEEATEKGLLESIGKKVDEAYKQELMKLSLGEDRSIKIVYSPLHGTGLTNVALGLKASSFEFKTDPKTDYPSGKFENVTFNIPNPEVEQSFETSLKFAKEMKADILLSSDPDSDRFGAMVNHNGEWIFLNGNEIAVILTEYVISKRPEMKGKGIVIKTSVTTDLLREICEKNSIHIIGDLLVGYKYVGEEMNKLERDGKIGNVLFSCEESHGYLIGAYAREKDAAASAILFAGLAAELKKINKTVIDYLQEVYSKYGYFRNYLTEIRLPGAEGRSQIEKIQDTLRQNPPELFGRFKVKRIQDFLDLKPILSTTDEAAKNMISFHIEPVDKTLSIKVTVRPSGTEPKIKMYYEIGSEPFEKERYLEVREEVDQIRKELEKDFMQYCYKIIGVDFPDRGFLLFWQLPLQSKLRYFEIEPEILELKEVQDNKEREEKLTGMLKFLGSNPLQKIDEAFKAKYDKTVTEYLEL
jgi:phosphoglucomutase